MASSLASLCEATKLSENEFESLFNPVRMGNAADIAYGGCALAFGVNAASQTVPTDYHLYSALGHFLGPASTEKKLMCSVRQTRSTRSFATRNVEIFQKLDDGKDRLVMFITTDFHLEEQASLLTFSAQPFHQYSPVNDTVDTVEAEKKLVEAGLAPAALPKIGAKLFGPMRQYTDQRICPEGIMAQNMAGLNKSAETTQDHLALANKTSGDWIKSKQSLQHPIESLTAVTFVMDGAVSFIPLTHDHKFLDDASACSSLDFALRFFTNTIDFNQWHLRELRSITGGAGRTYSESRLWDEEGKMVACMTQQAILRPKASRSSKF
ncbi:hypothetical protein FH972_021028 [Carpinus fangiana]|uniref:Acyl-CoA thioesterase II domain-containing protein n=1 Tax=Carpinus fangiana TaxID=176857 RepID=A0A5N6KNQ1_9ROSI|nr:hypothetical protein FH972_021028 [Carpinus fangiana]